VTACCAGRLSIIFHDLAVPANARVTSIPDNADAGDEDETPAG
jgi:hypothetical protein